MDLNYTNEIRARVLERMDLSREMSDEEIEELIGEETCRCMRAEKFSVRERVRIEQKVFNSLRKLDALQELIDDSQVTEIMVNGTDGIFVEREGRIRCWEHRFVSKTKLEDVVQQIAGKCNRIVNEAISITDARLENGDRVNIVLPALLLKKWKPDVWPK